MTDDMKKETENKISQLQLMEQNIQNFSMQKQQFQTQLFEVENALKELEDAKDSVYKIIGPLMIASDKKDLKKDLEEKKDMVELRIKNIEKQETSIKDKVADIQKEIMSELKQ